MIDLKNNPFYLSNKDIEWVNQTLNSMSLEEKIGQLFCVVGTYDKNELEFIINKIKPGGIMYRPDKGSKIRKVHKFLQDNSKIPLLLSANLEFGGNGIATDGTYFAKQMAVAATNDEQMAYYLGYISSKEAKSVGCNWSFAPVVDIDINFRNPITNVRTFGSNVDTIIKMAKKYIKACEENDIAATIKHFPGDGVDERDQHILTSINSLSTDEWDITYGKIYKELIEYGVKSIMVGHIALPSYSKKLNPNIKEIMPATLSSEIINDLLRNQLNFNGVICTDSTSMLGFTTAEKREISVPKSIASGCDVFLFNKNIKEDFQYMLYGIEKGLLTIERLNDAVIRILALKASLKLNTYKEINNLIPNEKKLDILKCPKHIEMARECADKSITLVKDSQKLLPITIDKFKKIRLYIIGDNEKGIINEDKITEKFKQTLEQKGFKVDLYDNKNLNFKEIFSEGIEDLKNKFDLAIYVANVETTSNKTTVRIDWQTFMAANAPWFVKEIPTLFISFSNPYHLIDLPMIETYINVYSANEYSIESVIDKITGKSEFKGISPVNPFYDIHKK